MPNRFLRESITTSVSLSRLSAEEERLFYRLIVQADDFGCFQAHPSVIRAHGFALLLDRVSAEDCGRWINALAGENIIHLYTGPDGKPYGHFVNWEKYQQRRAVKPKWPLPSCDSTCNQMITDAFNSEHMKTDALVSVSENVSVSVSENDKRERKPQRASQVSPAFELPEWIEQETWDAFMETRKKAKPPAANTDQARRLLISELVKLQAQGFAPAAVIEQSIRNGWKDVYALRDQKGGSNNGTTKPTASAHGDARDYPDGSLTERTRRQNERIAAGQV